MSGLRARGTGAQLSALGLAPAAIAPLDWLGMALHPLVRLVLALPPHLKAVALAAVVVFLFSAFSSVALLSLTLLGYVLRARNPARRKAILNSLDIHEETPGAPRRTVVGFFHPYCNAGGGGERVLWTAIACVQREERDLVCIVYTGDDVPKDAMIAKVQARFGITLDPATIAFVTLKKRHLVEDCTWPRFTLLGQSIGSIFLALEALQSGMIPDVWIDTMGYAFPYPLVRMLCRIPVGSYIHYPTISTDMLHRVQRRQAGHTNPSTVAKSVVLTYVKLFYYLIFAELYSLCLRQAGVLMVNSTWTNRHVNRLLRPFGFRDDAPDPESSDEDEEVPVAATSPTAGKLRRRKQSAGVGEREGDGKVDTGELVEGRPAKRFKVARTVYPPCDTVSLAALPLEGRDRVILSIAQFRPEKEHHVQLRALKFFLDANPAYRTGPDRYTLIMAGSVRNQGDEDRVELLRGLAIEWGINDNVEFAINVPYPALVALLGRASIGLHTMIDEHFGITVVEFMAAGLIPLVHASAGPLLDIVTPYASLPTGFHAHDPLSFSTQLAAIVELDLEAVAGLRDRARRSAVERFSEGEFEKGWMRAWGELMQLKKS